MEHQDLKEVTIGRRAGASSGGMSAKAAKDPKAVAAVRCDAMRCDAMRCDVASIATMNDVSDARVCVCRACIQALRAGMAVQTIKKGMMRACARARVGVGVVDGGSRGRRSGRL